MRTGASRRNASQAEGEVQVVMKNDEENDCASAQPGILRPQPVFV